MVPDFLYFYLWNTECWRLLFYISDVAWRYQRGNKNAYIEGEQTKQFLHNYNVDLLWISSYTSIIHIYIPWFIRSNLFKQINPEDDRWYMFCNRDKIIDIWQGALVYDIIFRRACCTMYKHRPFASGFNTFWVW